MGQASGPDPPPAKPSAAQRRSILGGARGHDGCIGCRPMKNTRSSKVLRLNKETLKLLRGGYTKGDNILTFNPLCPTKLRDCKLTPDIICELK